MLCRNCGTEIADKALICYRCGTATTEAKFKPPVMRRRTSLVGAVAGMLALVLLIAAALYMARATTGEVPQTFVWVVVAAAVLGMGVIAIRALGFGTRRR